MRLRLLAQGTVACHVTALPELYNPTVINFVYVCLLFLDTDLSSFSFLYSSSSRQKLGGRVNLIRVTCEPNV